MTISTSWGDDIEITHARLIPVWIVHYPGEIKWLYHQPKFKSDKNIEMSLEPIWHIKGIYLDTQKPMCDSKWMTLHRIVATNGIVEIIDKCCELTPEDAKKYELWVKSEKLATELFDVVDDNDIA